MTQISSLGSPAYAALSNLIVQSDDATIDTAASSPTAGLAVDESAETRAASPLKDLRSQIERNVSTAIDNLAPGSSPKDIYKAIRSAVIQTLKDHGIDVGDQVDANKAKQPHAVGTQVNGTDADGDGDNDSGDPVDALDSSLGQNVPVAAPASTSSSAAIVTDALSSLLRQVTRESDASNDSTLPSDPLLAAISSTVSANGKAPDLTALFSQLFQGFPSGTAVDVKA